MELRWEKGERGRRRKERRVSHFYTSSPPPPSSRVDVGTSPLSSSGKASGAERGREGREICRKIGFLGGRGGKRGVLCRTRYCAVDQRRTSVVVTPPRKKRKQSLEQEGLVCWGRSERSLSLSLFIPSFARRLIFKVPPLFFLLRPPFNPGGIAGGKSEDSANVPGHTNQGNP